MKKTILLGTRKGLISFTNEQNDWQLTNFSFEGIPVSIAFSDERNGTWWAGLDHGHWGVKLHRSYNEGVTWEEVPAPIYPAGYEIKEGVPASTKYIWAMSHGGKKYPQRLWVGTDPGGLFISEDGGNSFSLIESLWNHPTRKEGWFGGGRDNPGIHSIIVDPTNEDHIYIAISCAGVFESFDSGDTWQIINKGLNAEFLPNPDAETGHDPHILVMAPTDPKILWQQNHCGIYVSTNGGKEWIEVSEATGPARFGFAIAVADDNPLQAWVAPAHSDERRIPINQALSICRTDNGGKTWKSYINGLPQQGSFDIVYRHALVSKGATVIFGTTTGNLFISEDRGENWKVISNYLPMVHSVMLV